MPESLIPLEEEILELYRSPIIGASYNNTYGEENIKSLVEKFSVLDEQKSQIMSWMIQVLY